MKFFVFILFGWFSTLTLASDALLVPVSRPSPEYPQELLKSHYTGKVLINLTVSAFGTIQSTRIIESSHPKLSEAALHAIVKWRYQPWGGCRRKTWQRQHRRSNSLRCPRH